ISEELNQAGLVPVSDLYTNQAILAQMQMEVADQQSILDIEKGKLAISLSLPIETVIELAAIQCPPVQQKQQTIDLIALAKKQRADLMAKQASITESLSLQDK